MIYQVTTNSTPVKTDISPYSKIIARLDRSTKIDVLEIDKRWAQILYNDQKAYVSTMYIVPCEDEDDITIEAPSTEPAIPEKDLTPDVPSTEPTTPEEDIATEVTSAETITPKYENIYGNVVVRYIDVDTKASIKPDKAYDMLNIGEYIICADYIDEYLIIGNAMQNISLYESNKIVIVTFEYKKLTCKVIINYIDIDSNENILSNDIHDTLTVGNYTYEPKSIDGYMSVSDNKTILLDSTILECKLNFYYKKLL